MESSPLAKLAAVMPEVDPELVQQGYMADEYISYYKSNSAARKKRLKQQGAYKKLKKDHDPYSSKQAQQKAWHVRQWRRQRRISYRTCKGKTENASVNRRVLRKQRYAWPLLHSWSLHLQPNNHDVLWSKAPLEAQHQRTLWMPCVYCGETYELHELTLDHVHPKTFGGEDITSNLVPAVKSVIRQRKQLALVDESNIRY